MHLRALDTRPVRPILTILALAAILGFSGCFGGGGGLGLGGGGGGSSSVGGIVALEAEPRVDLPGRVSVFFRVVSGSGRGVAGLQGSDFELFENGNPVSQTESRQRLLPRPQIFRSYSLLLLDRSGSIAQSPTGEQEEIDAARAYINLVTEEPDSFLKLAWFDGQAGIRPVLLDDFSELGFTNDKGALLEAIENLHDQAPASTSTNLYGAVVSALDELENADLEAEQDGIAFRSLTLVTFTDGTDQAGISSLSEVTSRLSEVDEVVGQPRFNAFSIGLGSEIDEDVLERLGPEGTGLATGFDELTPEFEVVATAVRDLANSFYFLSYCSPKQNGSGAHTLTVRAEAEGVDVEESYDFRADFFSGGCGFLDVLDPMDTQGAFDVADMVEDDLGRVVVAGGFRAPGSTTSALFALRFLPDRTLDRSFGDRGRVVFPGSLGFSDAAIRALAIESDGTLVAAGVVGNGDLDMIPTRLALWRFTGDGSISGAQAHGPLDATEGDGVEDLALDDLGRLVVAGRSGRTAPFALLRRFDPTLMPDLSFGGGDGHVLYAIDDAAPGDEARALVIEPGGRIAVAGSSTSSSFGEPDLVVRRFLDDGTSDTTFGLGGIARNADFQGSRAGIAADLVLDGSGNYVVGGRLSRPTGGHEPVLWRLDPEGRPDAGYLGSPFSNTFGTGVVTLARALTEDPEVLFGADAEITSLKVRSDGSVLAAGTRRNAEGHGDLAMWRFNEEGMLEADYNGTGFLIDDGSVANDSDERATALFIHSDGRIWTAGRAFAVAGEEQLVLWVDGEVERVFAPTGNN